MRPVICDTCTARMNDSFGMCSSVSPTNKVVSALLLQRLGGRAIDSWRVQPVQSYVGD